MARPKRQDFCGRHRVDYYGTIGCPNCINNLRDRHRRVLAERRALKGAAERVRQAWLRGGAKTEDMKAACTMIDMALGRK